MKDLTAATITDAQIRDLRQQLFEGPADAQALHGLVATHQALGWGHRRRSARELCAKIFSKVLRERRRSRA
jgi:hypothetical protein